MTKREKGFTLIELLVVIAIIGILSSVVLASLNTARSKGNDAKIKANLSGLRTAAEIYYDNTSSTYGVSTDSCAAGMFADTTSGMSRYIASFTSPSCHSNGTAYAVSAPLGSGHWCVDSVGTSKSIANALGNGVTACP